MLATPEVSEIAKNANYQFLPCPATCLMRNPIGAALPTPHLFTLSSRLLCLFDEHILYMFPSKKFLDAIYWNTFILMITLCMKILMTLWCILNEYETKTFRSPHANLLTMPFKSLQTWLIKKVSAVICITGNTGKERYSGQSLLIICNIPSPGSSTAPEVPFKCLQADPSLAGQADN